MESACTSQDLAEFILETAASYKFVLVYGEGVRKSSYEGCQNDLYEACFLRLRILHIQIRRSGPVSGS